MRRRWIQRRSANTIALAVLLIAAAWAKPALCAVPLVIEVIAQEEAANHMEEKPRILLCTPPCAFAPINRFFYITNDAKLDRIPEIAALVRAVAEEQNLETVDLYAQTEGRRELFGPDGLHPNAAGAKLIADTVYRALNHQNYYD